ncbi:hypothetical protein [Streptomyces sp. NPDC050560]|uniref:hypothetical protein n=1 Tax=Streptomyces sp. NPDC050560 TaxID=3365630 RepID=UPI003799A0B3
MSGAWDADPRARLIRRVGIAPAELGTTGGRDGCPDIWELDNGDFAVIGRDLTAAYSTRLPDGAVIGGSERLVVIPRATLLAARTHLRDA